MAINRTLQCAVAVAALLTLGEAGAQVSHHNGPIMKRSLNDHSGQGQAPLAAEDAAPTIERILRNKAKQHVKVKYYTYDSYYLGDIPNITFTSDDMLEYANFGLFNVQTAQEHGFLAKEDMNCAASQPNALKSDASRGSSGPSVLHSNATALAAYGLSEFFDVIAFTMKPLGPAPSFSSIGINAWKIFDEPDGSKNATIVDSMFMFWFGEGYLPPDTLVPSELFGPWGEGVNFVEIEAKSDEDKTIDFCMDNLVLLFYPKEDDE